MKISVSPLWGARPPGRRAAVSKTRTTVVPTATTRPPRARVASMAATASGGNT